MKKIILALYIIHFSFVFANAQWLHQNSGTTADLRSVKFINPNTGWLCGYGIILKTTNGGVNWVSQFHPATDKPLYKIQPIDSNTVYCVGWFQTILKTTNGGTNWIAIRNGPYGSGNSFYGMYFLNYNTGWIIGGSPYILKTTNGGNSFDSIVYLGSNTKDIYFKDLSTGLLCGDVGKIRKSTNGGYNWFDANINLHNQGYEFKNLSILNNSTVWIIGRQVYNVYKSTDFGTNFDSVGYVNEGYEIYGVRFINNQTGWCGGGGIYTGRMFLTTNGGSTWQRKDDSTNYGFLWDIWFYNNNTGWTTGSNGILLQTTNGGISFVNKISSGVPDNFKLYQNYPNPFNSSSIIKYQVTRNICSATFITLKIIDALGREIATLVNEKQSSGLYETRFDAGRLSSGIYFYTLLVNGKIFDSKKMIILK